MSIPVKVTDASVRECVLYANLHLRGDDTNQIGTPMTVEISGAFDRWLAEHDAKVRAEALREVAEEADDWKAADGMHGGEWFPSEWAGQVAGWLEHRSARIREQP